MLPRLKLTSDKMDTMICHHCKMVVQLGSVGLANYFKMHKPSRACKENKEKKVAKEALTKTLAKAHQFFMPQGTAVPGPSASAAKLLVKPWTSMPAAILPASGSQVGLVPMPRLPTPSLRYWQSCMHTLTDSQTQSSLLVMSVLLHGFLEASRVSPQRRGCLGGVELASRHRPSKITRRNDDDLQIV